MLKIIVIIGHSWARRLLDAELYWQVPSNGGFDPTMHVARYMTCLPGVPVLPLSRDWMDNVGVLGEAVSVADLVVILLGTNDIAQQTDRNRKWADEAI